MRFFLLAALATLANAQESTADPAFFESRVRPVLAAKCQSCHGAKSQFSDLRLDSREAVLKGGQRGPGPEFIREAIRQQGPLKMPPGGKLSPAEIDAIDQWLNAGAPWPNSNTTTKPQAPHWAFQPLTKPAPQSIDRFLNTTPQPAAKHTLARRAAYVVTGLPPKPEILATFLDDNTPAAWPNYIDQLLASSRYGERWARHWLDLMRYAETYGYEWNYEIHGAWRYRDYLIRAFNRDLPFDQFIREHVAGDLLKNPRVIDGHNESALATAFWRFGEMGHDNCNQFPEIRTDVVDNQIDTLTKAFQAVTVSCARCHDHKFDPIPTEDYYALYGIINSARPIVATLNRPRKPDLTDLKSRIRSELAAIWLRQAGESTVPVPQWPAPSVDFSHGLPAGWSATGAGLEPVKAGDFAIAATGPAVIDIIFPDGLATNATTSKWNGALRSPFLPRDKKYLSFQLAGASAAAHRTVMDHCVIGEDHKLIEDPAPHLEKVPTRNDQPLRTYIEINTITDNPRLPERPGKFKTNPDEKVQRSWFAVSRAWYHDDADQPRPTTVELRLAAAIRRWSTGQATDLDVAALTQALATGLLTNSRQASPALARFVEEFRATEATLELPSVANTLADLDPGADHPILLSGQARNPGRPAPRHFLSLMPERLRAVNPSGSGRLELAEAIANPENPLTARVYVNRVWHHVFGTGIVTSTDNFGRLSDPPSNQPLLDHLAAEFMRHGWSTKRLLRELLLSDAFQRQNQIRRLDAESVRDTLLAVSGRLDEKMYGLSVQPHRTELTEYRRLFQGPLDGDGRRSIYLKVTRMQGPKFLEIFDFPAPLQTRGNRDVTNVPTQSLAMLNDPFVHQQAHVWAEQLVQRKDDTNASRIAAMFNLALGRPPSDAEKEAYLQLLAKFATHQDPAKDATAWQKLAHTLFNSKEFLYLH
ncbi:MAG: PSD1 domain-containing protein [Bryobacterales bacterium]|nr:PSD1 domain-containing protein [Bryobacterales bacterium]